MLTRRALGREIEGYASVCSASSGQTVEFYVNTAAPSYTIRIFRMSCTATAVLDEFGARHRARSAPANPDSRPREGWSIATGDLQSR